MLLLQSKPVIEAPSLILAYFLCNFLTGTVIEAAASNKGFTVSIKKN